MLLLIVYIDLARDVLDILLVKLPAKEFAPRLEIAYGNQEADCSCRAAFRWRRARLLFSDETCPAEIIWFSYFSRSSY